MNRSPYCHCCGRRVARRPRCGKYRYRHRCPHGSWCWAGDARLGLHANWNQACTACMVWGKRVEELHREGLPNQAAIEQANRETPVEEGT